MPDEQINEDLKNKGGDPSGDGQTDNNSGDGAGSSGEEDTVTISKKELDQIKKDRDNYREGLLSVKADKRNLDGSEGGEEGEEGEEGGEGGGEGGNAGAEGGSDTLTEDRVKQIVGQSVDEATKAAYKSNEKRAKRQFLASHPEYVDDTQWAQLLTNFSRKRGQATVEDILDDLKDAVILHKRDTGKLDEYLASERQRGERQGRTQAQFETGFDAGGTGDRNETGSEGEGLSEEGKEIAQGIHVDPKEAGKVDPKKDNVINVTK